MATCEAIRSMYIEDNSNTGFTWSSIPSTYESLRIVGSWCNAVTFENSGQQWTNIWLRMGNGSVSTSSIYGHQEMAYTYNSKAIGTEGAQTAFQMRRGMTGFGGYTALTSFVIDIYGYKDTDTLTSVNAFYGGAGQESTVAGEDTNLVWTTGLYNSTAVIDTIQLLCGGYGSGNVLAGSEAHLYGYKVS